ncbi:MAG: M56 family metallopeptidase [Gemmatimonadota bacterium]
MNVVAMVAPIVELATLPAGPRGDREPVGVLGILSGWRTELDRALASGAARLPPLTVPRGWIAAAWGATSILLSVVLVGSMLRLGRRVREWPEETLLGRRVKVSPGVGPATLGLLTPTIVVPRWALDLPRHELEMVLRHEGEHVRRRDTLLLAIGILAAIACPWNPAVWWQVRRLKAAVELDCDRRVLRHGVPAATYGDLLFRLGSRGRLGSLAVPTMAGSTSLLERRLTVMRKMQGRTSISTALSATAVALLLVAVACTSEAPVATDAGAASDAASATRSVAASEPEEHELVATIRVDRDGTVEVDDVVHPVGRVSEAVAPLYTENAVVSIEAHREAPYRVLSEVQYQLRAAGLLRVVFTTANSESLRSQTRELSTLLDEGLAMVFPDTSIVEISAVTVDPENLLFLEVLPAGMVASRRGDDPAVREITPADVEALWRQEVARNPSLIAVVRTHADAEYRHMYEVLGALQRAEAKRFTLQVAD